MKGNKVLVVLGGAAVVILAFFSLHEQGNNNREIRASIVKMCEALDGLDEATAKSLGVIGRLGLDQKQMAGYESSYLDSLPNNHGWNVTWLIYENYVGAIAKLSDRQREGKRLEIEYVKTQGLILAKQIRSQPFSPPGLSDKVLICTHRIEKAWSRVYER